MAEKIVNHIRFENCASNQIMFRNFSGKPDQYNPAGRREFTLVFSENDSELVERLEKDGWNIRWLPARDEGDLDRASMKVALNFNNIPPKVVRISGRDKITLDESTVGQLDFDDIESFDLDITPYNWSVNGKSGVKGYVKTMYVVVAEDPFAAKYSDVDEEVPFD